jgi:DNA modification methylase
MTVHSPNAQARALANALPPLERRLGPIEYWDIDKVTAYDRNPRKHPEKQIVKLMASISEFGMALPILVDADGVIICGHARIEAAGRLGMTQVPVLEADHWGPAQVRAYRLMDNKLPELASWDLEALAIELASIIEIEEVAIDLLGWETAEIDLILDGEPDAVETADPADDVPDLPPVPVSRIDDLWLLGDHRLICGSSLEPEVWTRVTDGDIADMVFTDPPYNVRVDGHISGLGKKKHAEFAMASGEMSKPEFTAFLVTVITRFATYVRDGAIFDVCMDWRHLSELLAAIEECGLSLLNLCVWNKTNGGMGSLYRSKHELVLIAKKGTAPHTNNVQLGRYGRYRTNVWDYPGVNSFGSSRMADLAIHPTVKPVALVADAIRDVTKPGEIVLDGFIGSGSTILAAERTRRVAYGIEIEPGYVDVAIHRWEKMTGNAAILAETGENFAEVTARRANEAPDSSAPGPELLPSDHE